MDQNSKTLRLILRLITVFKKKSISFNGTSSASIIMESSSWVYMSQKTTPCFSRNIFSNYVLFISTCDVCFFFFFLFAFLRTDKHLFICLQRYFLFSLFFIFKNSFLNLLSPCHDRFKELIKGLRFVSNYFQEVRLFLVHLHKCLKMHLIHFHQEMLFVCQPLAVRKLRTFYLKKIYIFGKLYLRDNYHFMKISYYKIQIALSLLHTIAEKLSVCFL